MLDVSHLEVAYHDTVRALRGLSLDIGPGRIVALLGPNGAGKTTLLKSIAGLLSAEGGRVTSGTIGFEGKSVLGVAPHVLARRGIVYVHEGRKVFTALTIEDNLRAASHALRGRAKKPDYGRIYDLFPELAARRRQPAGYLSGGERQMLSLGRAIVADPKLILLDEPSLGLAPKMIETVFSTVAQISGELNVSILVADQNVFATLRISQYGHVLEQGRIVIEGSPDALLDNREVQDSYLGIKTA
ncbi:MAG: ABC transporter ATP-binding protein [Alphaproteobacteria bacterium]|nr:ABC transporter ATP-binding protein [Alphaproteobacteria bacterium]